MAAIEMVNLFARCPGDQVAHMTAQPILPRPFLFRIAAPVLESKKYRGRRAAADCSSFLVSTRPARFETA